MMTRAKIWLAALVLLTALAVGNCWAGPIRFEGVLGNSGADGSTLAGLDVDGAGSRNNNAGLGLDRLGRLWAFGGRDRVNAYAPDGRLTGSFPLPGKKSERHTLVVAGDWVVLNLGEKLYRLPIAAPAGQSPEALRPTARALSLNAVDGAVAVVGVDGAAAIFHPADGTLKPQGVVGTETRGNRVVLMPDGSLLLDGAWQLREGHALEKSKAAVGASAQLAGGYIYTFASHMTVARNSLALQPEPGVVFGGSAGYFIGSLTEDAEIGSPCGIAPLGGDRFAIAGETGIIHLVVWNAGRQAFESARRLGAVHFPAALALDPAGRTWFFCGYWDWTDTPEHILRSPTNNGGSNANAQAGVLPGGQVVYPVVERGAAGLQCRAFDEPTKRTVSDVPGMPAGPTGLAVFSTSKGGSEVVIVNGQGAGIRLSVDASGKSRKMLGPCQVQLTSKAPDLTSLAALGPDECLAADAGSLVRLRREGDNFREVSRVNQLPGLSPLGPRIYLATSSRNLWISDTGNNRVIHVVMLDAGKFGEAAVFMGTPGLVTPLSAPQRICAAGNRAIVLDWQNQRIVRLSCAP